MGRDATAQAANLNIVIRGDIIQVVPQFRYLGSIFSSDNTFDVDINHRMASAGFAWHHEKAAKLWCSKHLSLARKVLIFRSIVVSNFLYASGTFC